MCQSVSSPTVQPDHDGLLGLVLRDGQVPREHVQAQAVLGADHSVAASKRMGTESCFTTKLQLLHRAGLIKLRIHAASLWPHSLVEDVQLHGLGALVRHLGGRS